MSEPKAYPPSGRTLFMFGRELNSEPREVLLQVIEALFPIRSFPEEQEWKAECMNSLAKRLRPTP